MSSMSAIKLPNKPENKFRNHNWDDPELKNWKDKTVRAFQEAHVNDNANTKTFSYKRSETDILLLRLCILYYGQKSNILLEDYKTEETNYLKPFIKLLKKHCTDKIQFNVFYVSVGIKQKDGTFADQEIPLLQLACSGKVIDLSDSDCLYLTFYSYLNKNKLPKSVIIYPSEATYAVETDTVFFKACESPSCNDNEVISETVTKTSLVSITMSKILKFFNLCYTLINNIVQSLTFNQVFDDTQDTFNEIRQRLLTTKTRNRFNEDINANSIDSPNRAYLIQTVNLIEDVESFYGNIVRTQSSVSYNKNRFVLNNNMEMCAEFYNQIGKKEIIAQQVLEQKSFNKNAVEKMMQQYDKQKTQSAKNYANGTINQEEFLNEVKHIEASRKAKLFDASAAYKNTPSFLDTCDKAERVLSNGKKLEEWITELKNLNAAYKANPQNVFNYTEKVQQIELNITQAESVRAERNAFQNSLNSSHLTSNNFSVELLNHGGQDFITETKKFIKDTDTFRRANTERLTTYFDSAVVKHSLQHAFGVLDYKNIKVNDKAIFKDLTENELPFITAHLKNKKHAKKMIEASVKLLDDANCTWNGMTANEVGSGVKLLGSYLAYIKKNKNTDPLELLKGIIETESEYDAVKTFFNEAKSSVDACYAANPSCQHFDNVYSAASHYLKHDKNPTTSITAQSVENYLVIESDAIFQILNFKVERTSQDGASLKMSYAAPINGQCRHYVGISSIKPCCKPTTVTTFEK